MFETKDSGKRQQFGSGMQRDTQDNKTLYHLVYDGPLFKRWAELLTRGAKKYSEGNWLKATGPDELKRFKASAARHFFQWYMDETDEDHAAAVTFNINGAEYVKGKMQVEIENRITPVDLMEKGETFTDDDVVDALYEVQEGAGTPSPHARETAERFNSNRPYYDETFTGDNTEGITLDSIQAAMQTVPAISKKVLVIPEGCREDFENLRFAEDGQVVLMQNECLPYVPPSFNGVEIQWMPNLSEPMFVDYDIPVDLSALIKPAFIERMAEAAGIPNFAESCSVEPPFNLVQRMLIKLQDFYHMVKSKLAKVLYNEAIALDPEVAYDDVES